MSSRQEEKARRRAEREEQERRNAAAAARTRRLQLAGGAVLGLAAIAAVVVVIAGSGGGGTKKADRTSAANAVALPPVRETNLQKAAKDAGCTLLNPPIEGRTHTTSPVTYHTNPPSSGNHNPVPAEDGYYAPGNEPAKEHYVHTLEHGRIELEYKDARWENDLESVADEKFHGTAGYHMLVFQNNTNMPYAVAAVAWGHILGCKTMTPRFYDAERAFRNAYTDKGPELIP